MKALRPVVCPVIVACLLIVSFGINGIADWADVSRISYHMSGEQASYSEVNGSNANREWVRGVAIADNSLFDSGSASSYERAVTNDPYVSHQWALEWIDVSRLWRITSGSPEVTIAVVDTGIDGDHEDLIDKVVAEINFSASPSPHDSNGHGTHIAGILVANRDNRTGIAGLAAESRLFNVKVADDSGRCEAAAVAKGITWAADNGASVINLSLELNQPSSELETAIDYAWERGAVVVAAAGNKGSSLPTYPAYYRNAIAVAAITNDGNLAPLSNYGDWIDMAAPGFNIYSTLPGNSYGYKSGTSFAAAYVSGLAALFFVTTTDTNGNGRVNDEVRAAIEADFREAGGTFMSTNR